MKKRLLTILAVVVTSVTTATLDWTLAKVTEIEFTVPIVTPMGVTEQPVVIKEKRGRFSGHRYKYE
jgi:hypothetical protein